MNGFHWWIWQSGQLALQRHISIRRIPEAASSRVRSSHELDSRAPPGVSRSRAPPPPSTCPRAVVRARHFAPRGGRPAAFLHVPRPTGSRSRAPTSHLRWPPRRLARPLNPRAAFSRAASAPRGGRAPRTCSHGPVLLPRAGGSRAPPRASRGGLAPPPSHVHGALSRGQSFSRAHFSTSRWPCPATSRRRPTGSRSRRPQHLEVAALRRALAPVPLVLQNTSRVPVLQQAQVSEARRVAISTPDLTPRRVHGVAHPRLRAKPAEVPGSGEASQI